MTQTIDSSASLPSAPPTSFLEVRDLRVAFPTDDGLVKSVDGLSFKVERGKTMGIVGESGSGKSVTSQAILGLHNSTRAQVSGQIWLDGEELVGKSSEEIRPLRGNKMAMIFQDPLSSLHPFYTIGGQIVEAYRVHNKVSKDVAKKRAIEMLDRVGIPNAGKRVDDYPHQFSGGMRQRVMIAMALVCDPQLLIADEPTTALDVTVQAQILDLMRDLQKEFNSAIILITHDLGVVAETCQRVMVMYAGRKIEEASVTGLFDAPAHPYTRGLMASIPRLNKRLGGKRRLSEIPGMVPSLRAPIIGCAFAPRCSFATERCRAEAPDLRAVGSAHIVACHHAETVLASPASAA